MVKDQAGIGKGPSLEEKLEISARVAAVLFEEKVRLTAEEVGGRLGVPAEVLRAMAKRRRSWSGWPSAMRFEDDVFSMAPGWRWFEAAVVRASSGEIIRVEDDFGERADLPDTTGAFLSLLPGDRLLAAQDNGGCGYAAMLAFLEQPSRRVVCTVPHGAAPRRDKSWHLPVSSRFFESAVSCSTLPLPASSLPEEGLRVVVETEPRPAGIPHLPRGRVVEVLGPASSPETELKIAIEEHGLRREFPAEVLAQAEGLPDDPPGEEAEGRVDLRDIAFVTIDGDDARDFDDAVYCCSCESGWRLLVAIADVSRYVAEGSPLDIEAQQRGTSAYFPSCVIPMLPEKLSNGLCSLNPGVDRAVMVCDMVIGPDGRTEAYQFYPGLIHSHARLTYGSVWAAIQGRDEDFLARGGREDLEALRSLYGALRKAREKRGAIDFEIAETEVRTGSDGLVESITRREHNDAHRIIEECMLAANVCAADFISGRRHPCLYRVHEEPSPERLAELRSVLLTLGCRLDGGSRPSASDFRRVLDAIDDEGVSGAVQGAMLRSMQRAVYTPENCGHYGLAYPAYTHFTSPIRRYPDLLVHRTIRAIMAGRKYVPAVYPAVHPLPESSDGRRLLGEDAARSREAPAGQPAGGWKELGLLCSAAERRADSASRDVAAWLKCRFASGLVGNRFDGTVTGTNRAGLFVSLDSPFIEGFVHVSRIGSDYYDYEAGRGCFTGRSGGETFGIGRRVRVEIEGVDAEMRRIDFRVVGSGAPAT